MNSSREELQMIFEELLGSREVYYQPPRSITMHYPAIVYSRSDIRVTHANNASYRQSNAYEVTVIDEDPDSEVVEKVSKLPMCRFSRHYTADNLNHDVFQIFYEGGIQNE